MTEPMCTCTELQRMTFCHDMRNEPHVVGCPHWGTPTTGGHVGPGDLRLPDNTHWYDEGGVIPPGLTRVRNDSGEDEQVIPA